jgi:hypothetical protein
MMSYFYFNQISVIKDVLKTDEENPEGVERLNYWYTGPKIISYHELN